MKSTHLSGEYDLTIDDKNRLLIPAEVRRGFDKDRDGEAFFITVGRNRHPWLIPEKWYEALAGQIELGLSPSPERLAFAQLMFAMASRAEWDKQGRLLLAEKYRTRTNLGREVTLVGVGSHLELWNRADWLLRYDDLDSRRDEITSDQQRYEQQASVNRVPVALPVTIVSPPTTAPTV